MYNMDNLIISFTDEFRVLLLLFYTDTLYLVFTHRHIFNCNTKSVDICVYTCVDLMFRHMSPAISYSDSKSLNSAIVAGGGYMHSMQGMI
jgi:hypothetical protein